MAGYEGDYRRGATVRCTFTTVDKASGAPIVLTGTPAISIYKDGGTTESTTGVTLTASLDSHTGMNHVAIDTSADRTFYSAGSKFDVVITAGTADGVSMVGYVVGHFTIEVNALAQAEVLLRSAITTVTSQLIHILTTGAADDNAYNGCLAIFEDGTTEAQKSICRVSGYTGSTKTLKLASAPSFTVTSADRVTIIAAEDAIAARDVIAMVESQRGHHTAAGKRFYVQVGGSDSNTGLSPSAPLATIAAALTLCTANAHDTVILMPVNGQTPSSWNESITMSKAFTLLRGMGRDTRILGSTAATPTITITATGCEVSGVLLDNTGTGSSHDTIKLDTTSGFAYIHDCYIDSAKRYGIGIAGGSRHLIEENHIIAVCTAGVSTINGAGSGLYPIIRRNVINMDGTGIGVRLDGNEADEAEVSENKLRDLLTGVTVLAGVNDAAIFDNRFANCGTNISDAGTATHAEWNDFDVEARAAVGLATANLDTQLGLLATASALSTAQADLTTIKGYTDGVEAAIEVVRLLVDTLEASATTIAGYTDTVEASLVTALADLVTIKNKTDNLPTDPADQSAVEAAITAAQAAIALLIDALPTAVENQTGMATSAAVAALDSALVKERGTCNALNIDGTIFELDAGESGPVAEGDIITILSGTGAGQSRVIHSMNIRNASTHANDGWVTPPDATSVYVVVTSALMRVQLWAKDAAVAAELAVDDIALVPTASENATEAASVLAAAHGAGSWVDTGLTDLTPVTGALSNLQTSVNSVDADLALVPAAVDSTLTLAHGAGSWGSTSEHTEVMDALTGIQTSVNSVDADLALVPTAVDAALTSAHGSGAWNTVAHGQGAIEWEYALTVAGNALPDADVWVTSDVGGDVILASGRTDQAGLVTFYLDAGTVYVWRQKSGYNFTNPDTEVVA